MQGARVGDVENQKARKLGTKKTRAIGNQGW